MRVPTSTILEHLIRDAPRGEVTLAWIIAHLGERSFGIVMLLVALVGIGPGTSPLIGIVLAALSVQMILGRAELVLPWRIAQRRLSSARLVRLLQHTVPTLVWLERIVQPRWTTPFESTKRVIGVAILLLSATFIAPIPSSQVVPVLVIMLIAFAFLEEDGVLLGIALVAATFSVAITAAAIWGTLEASLLF